MSFNLTCPSLLGLLLVVSSHNGPQLVFHYPPELSGDPLGNEKNAAPSLDKLKDEDYLPEDEADFIREDTEWDASHLDFYLGTKTDIFTFLEAKEKRGPLTTIHGSSANTMDSEKETRRSTSFIQSRKKDLSASKTLIFGFEPDYLSEMLCPPKPMCNSRFELIVDNIVFLGLPVHVYDDGSWRVSKSKAHKTTSERSGVENRQNRDSETSQLETTETDAEHPDGYNSTTANSMTMFHVVFVMNPLEIERNYRIDEMFYYVTSKLSLVLRYEQLKTDYMRSEVREVSRLKESWRSLPETQLSMSLNDYLVDNSSLCKVMADCFKAISTSQIANLKINEKLRSFQIPLKMEFSSLPESTVPFIPGSHLSSTSVFLSTLGLISLGETTRYRVEPLQELVSAGHLQENPAPPNADENLDVTNDDTQSSANDIIYFALLLLDEPEYIIKKVRADQHTALAKFIRLIKPTESLLKLSERLGQLAGEKHGLTISQINSFAFHLIYWRCARMIVPLSPRAIYIVSPMAPLTTKLREDLERFKKDFTTLPSLPQFLRLISTRSRKPKQFAVIIPSRDHKDIYLSALAWLVRHGYVTQLHTYIWFKVPRKVKMKVEEELETELGGQPRKRSESEDIKDTPATDNKVGGVYSTDNTSKQNNSNPHISASFENDMENLLARLGLSSLEPEIVFEEDSETILVDPGRASAVERRWINKIIYEECKLSPDLIAVFFKLLKYMNGKSSLEVLLLKENISRTDLRRLLLAVEDYIISVRHW